MGRRNVDFRLSVLKASVGLKPGAAKALAKQSAKGIRNQQKAVDEIVSLQRLKVANKTHAAERRVRQSIKKSKGFEHQKLTRAIRQTRESGNLNEDRLVDELAVVKSVDVGCVAKAVAEVMRAKSGHGAVMARLAAADDEGILAIAFGDIVAGKTEELASKLSKHRDEVIVLVRQALKRLLDSKTVRGTLEEIEQSLTSLKMKSTHTEKLLATIDTLKLNKPSPRPSTSGVSDKPMNTATTDSVVSARPQKQKPVKADSSREQVKANNVKEQVKADSSREKVKANNVKEQVKADSSREKVKANNVKEQVKADSSREKVKANNVKEQVKADSSREQVKANNVKEQVKADSSREKVKAPLRGVGVEDTTLHPSWVAKRSMGQAAQTFSGKRVTFDSDSD